MAARKTPGHSKRKYKDPQDMIDAIDVFFDDPPIRRVCNRGEWFEVPDITTQALAHGLGFRSLQSLYDYENLYGEEFAQVIEYARSKMISYYECIGQHVAPQFSQYMLNSLGVKAPQQVDQISSDGSMRPTTIQLVGPDDESES